MKFWDASAIIPLLADEPTRERLLKILEADPEMLAWWGTPVEIASALARREREKLLTPGEVYRVRVDLWATANVFAQGHRVRLDISSSNFPMYDVNPNTGEPIGRHTKLVKADQTVFSDAGRPSRVVLPVIPA